MSHYSMDCYASLDSTRVPSSSPSASSSSSFDHSLITTDPLSLFNNDIQQISWAFDNNSDANGTYTGALFGPPLPYGPTTQQAVEAVLYRSSPPTIQLRNLSISSSPTHSPCGSVTYVQSMPIVAPQPISSSPTLIGRGCPMTFQPPPFLNNALAFQPPAAGPPEVPPRPQTHAKIPPEKVPGRKSFPCLHSGCGMKFPKRNALVQHMRSHTGERPEVCDWCGRRFSLKCNLRRHWRTCKTKKAMEAANAIKRDPSYSPPPSDPSSSPDAGPQTPPAAPAVPVATPSHSAPSAELFAAPPSLYNAGFTVPLNYSSAPLDMNCNTFFPSPLPSYSPYSTFVQAHL